jgi:hypothetical protein
MDKAIEKVQVLMKASIILYRRSQFVPVQVPWRNHLHIMNFNFVLCRLNFLLDVKLKLARHTKELFLQLRNMVLLWSSMVDNKAYFIFLNCHMIRYFS